MHGHQPEQLAQLDLERDYFDQSEAERLYLAQRARRAQLQGAGR